MMAPEHLADARIEAYRFAKDWLRNLPDDHWNRLLVSLIKTLDTACQQKLTGGRADLFCSVQACKARFEATIQDWDVPGKPTSRPEIEACFQAVLARLRDDGHALFVSDRQRMRSRAFEIVHYLRNLRQRTKRRPLASDSPDLVDMVKVAFQERSRPRRDAEACGPEWFLDWDSDPEDAEALESAFESSEDVDGELDLERAAYVLGLKDEADFEEVREKADETFQAFLEQVFGDAPAFAPFQKRAFQRLLHSALNPSGRPHDHVIAADTGFGKTEAFLFPILYYTLCQSFAQASVDPKRRRDGIDALLLYPRRDLCDNQAERLLQYLLLLDTLLAKRQEDVKRIRVALAHSNVGEGWRIKCPECATIKGLSPDERRRGVLRAVMGSSPHARVIRFECMRDSGHETAADLLVHQLKSPAKKEATLAITTIDTLHRRLMDNYGRSSVFAQKQRPPRFVVVDEVHIYEGQSGAHAAQILRRSRERIRRMSLSDGRPPVLVGASATAGQPIDLAQRMFGNRHVRLTQPSQEETETLGLEYFFFLQAPGTRRLDGSSPDAGATIVTEQSTMIQAAFCLQHAIRTPEGSGQKRRVLGFVDSLDLASRLSRNIDNAEWQNLLRATRPATPLFLLRHPRGRPQDLECETRLRAFVAQSPGREGDAGTETQQFPAVGSDCPKAETRDCFQPPHHLLERCERYEIGECWYSMATPGEEGLLPLRIQSHRSGARGRQWGDPTRQFRPERDRDDWRLLISTSALEVGFDHEELIATWQWHAPPSIASFIQRKGRGGRGIHDFPITMMVLGPSSGDTFVFQDHMKWVTPQDLDYTSIIDEKNPSVANQHLVSTIFDFCAAHTAFANAFNLGMTELYEALKSDELLDWISRAFGLSSSDVHARVASFGRQVQSVWQRALEPGPKPNSPDTPVALFQPSAPTSQELAVWEHTLSERSPEMTPTRRWLQARQQAYEQASYGPGNVVEFCRFAPITLFDDPTLRVPSTTIPVPLGRFVDLHEVNGQRNVSDAAEAALRYFLPGGFKIRYEGELWMAPWRPVSDHPPGGPTVAWAATSTQVDGTREDTPIQEALHRSTLPVAAHDHWLQALGVDCHIRTVQALQIESLGRPTARSFSLHRPTMTVVGKRDDGEESAAYEQLPRDPHVHTQTFYLPISGENAMHIPLPDSQPLVDDQARYYKSYRIDKIHYANLVTCYRTNDEPITLVVKFWDEHHARPLAPAIRLTTQAMEFVLDWTGVDFPSTGRSVQDRYWSVVSRLLFENCLVADGSLQSHFLIPRVVTLLRFLEVKSGEFREASPDTDLLEERLERVPGRLRDTEHVWCSDHLPNIVGVLQRARAHVESIGLVPVLASTLAAALRRAAARQINVASTGFRTLVHHLDRRQTRIVLFDDLEGGSGNIRCLQDRWRGERDLLRRVARDESRCPAGVTDEVLAAALAADWTPEALSQFALGGHQWPEAMNLPDETYHRQRALQRLRPLVLTPSIAAFSCHSRREWDVLTKRFGGPPDPLRFKEHMRRTPGFDPRAEGLRKRFIETNELGPRIQSVLPLCPSACPECLIEDRFDGGISVADSLDRHLLKHVAEFGK